MKKIFIVILFLAFTLSGCSSIFNREEKSIEYKLLSEQYNEFLFRDISIYDQFADFIDDSSLNTALASVALEVQFYDNKGELLETKIGSGIIFYSDTLYYHVVTTYDLVHTERGRFASYNITDSYGMFYRAVMRYESEDYGLSGIAFVKDQMHTLRSINLSPYEPLIGEPAMLIGYQHQIINSRSMGLITDNDIGGNQYITLNIASDVYGNGGAIININNELIGIQDYYNDDTVYAIGLQSLTSFYDLYIKNLFEFE
ncbi:MAG: trypsin-like peptidase domain-containing protein [Acholeplasmataceae bacterium]|nr:trypsin-like peptidase domain-containing protein [Acholeplasmataceae bacterium]